MDSSIELDSLRRGDLAGARRLRLGGLCEFPREIFALADTLEVLDLSGGGLTSLPDDMGRLHRLRALFCSGNPFERLPSSLGDCAALSQIGFRATGLREVPAEALPPRLRWLTLTDNRIERLPESLGERPLLQKLMLAGNRLQNLPESMAGAASLELIRLSSNAFETLPPWLATLPGLAWISWAGNPCERPVAPVGAQFVSWAQLEVDALLGEGASGRVHSARWSRPGGCEAEAVALKLYKGSMTSDGLPSCEMAACLAAGDHPNLIGTLGRLTDHPDGAEALVMPLLPAHWRVLAGPPSLESCSRDVYDPALGLSVDSALEIARCTAAAAAHLHERGIMHGDLYAHNTLWDGETGKAKLSDFGAACALPHGPEGEAWRRVEVRAWGLLLGELLEQCAPHAGGLEKLRELEALCVQPDSRARPLMDDVTATLEEIGARAARSARAG
ncbi:leucine-rich repeat-containing protein kinase family protein [Methylocystis heyeri]|uniref:Protein kinase n=1 Tax=Methylocystis heyeri TaxID=391905 RepID=A0A6B8K9F9_9HYPH|nr:leucine-rich repeat-containing protein kinase family protein [Methylocystis heyeri]QGM44347.1 protein kinase [Methylocystis heyeri]